VSSWLIILTRLEGIFVMSEFNQETRLAIAEEFIRRLISPEVYGLQLSDEVRVEAVRALKLISTTYK